MNNAMNKRLALLAVGLACALGVRAAEIRLVVDADHPGPVIDRHVYGQFAEHLGAGVYGGLWVGPESRIPNVRGWRKDVVSALKALKVPLIRWPGGCFADEYHWRDGIGPRGQRPVKLNTNWGGVAETNAVGTHEFFDLAEQIGAEAYVNGNLGTGSAREMAEWMEYMTAEGDSTLARMRRRNGRDRPFRVSYFAVGNEAWGCGGQMRPEYYADQFRQVVAFLKAPEDKRPVIIASGGTGQQTNWTETLSDGVPGVDAISHHEYTLPTGNWKHKGSAVGFPESEWIATLAHTLAVDDIIRQNSVVLDRNDPQKKIGFYFDEWGSWYDAEPGSNPGFLVQRNTLRDALLAALHFNVFHAHADRVRMSNVAQMVNVLQAMIQTRGDQLVLTPTYHAFSLYAPFQDATSLPSRIENNPAYQVGAIEMPRLSSTAARGASVAGGKVWSSSRDRSACWPSSSSLGAGAALPAPL